MFHSCTKEINEFVPTVGHNIYSIPKNTFLCKLQTNNFASYTVLKQKFVFFLVYFMCGQTFFSSIKTQQRKTI